MHVDDKNISEITVKFSRHEIQTIIFTVLLGLGLNKLEATAFLGLSLHLKELGKLDTLDEGLKILVNKDKAIQDGSTDVCFRFFQQYIHNYSDEGSTLSYEKLASEKKPTQEQE